MNYKIYSSTILKEKLRDNRVTEVRVNFGE